MNPIIRHGEVVLKPVDTIPEGSVPKKTESEIVAHSETGHHHVLEAPVEFTVWTKDSDTYIEIPNEGKLVHMKTGNDVHTPHVVAPGRYQVIKKREYDYFQRKLREVRD